MAFFLLKKNDKSVHCSNRRSIHIASNMRDAFLLVNFLILKYKDGVRDYIFIRDETLSKKTHGNFSIFPSDYAFRMRYIIKCNTNTRDISTIFSTHERYISRSTSSYFQIFRKILHTARFFFLSAQ